jgi:hypothetical protein
MVFFLCEFTERRFKFSGTKNQTAAQNAANDLNPNILVWWDHAFWKKEKNCSEKEVAKIKHLTPDIDVLNARNMITLTSSRTGNSRRNRCIYSTRECAFLFLLESLQHMRPRNDPISLLLLLKNNPNTEQRVASRERAIGNREKNANRSKKSFKTGVIFRSSNEREREREREREITKSLLMVMNTSNNNLFNYATKSSIRRAEDQQHY